MDKNELEAVVQEINKKLDVIYEAVIGDPRDQNKPGLIMRLDRVEQLHILQRRFNIILGTTIVGTAGTILGALIVKALT